MLVLITPRNDFMAKTGTPEELTATLAGFDDYITDPKTHGKQIREQLDTYHQRHVNQALLNSVKRREFAQQRDRKMKHLENLSNLVTTELKRLHQGSSAV